MEEGLGNRRGGVGGAIVLIWMNLLWDLKTSVPACDIPQFYRTAETNR